MMWFMILEKTDCPSLFVITETNFICYVCHVDLPSVNLQTKDLIQIVYEK